MTYQERQADFTGGAANFFLVTPLGAAADTIAVACSVMTDRLTDMQTDRLTDRSTDRQTDRQTGRQAMQLGQGYSISDGNSASPERPGMRP